MCGADAWGRLAEKLNICHNSVNLSESPGVTASFSRALLGVCSSDGSSAQMLAVVVSDKPGEAGISLLKGRRSHL